MPGKAQTTGTSLEFDTDSSGSGPGTTVDQGAGGSDPWLIEGTVSVDNFPASQAVTGSVSVSNFPASQPISGTVAVSSVGGTVATLETPPSAVLNGQKLIAVAGTQAAIAASTPCKSVTVKALTTNTGLVYVGDSSVDSATGFPLRAGESISMDIANLATVFIDVSVNTEGAAYLGVN